MKIRINQLIRKLSKRVSKSSQLAIGHLRRMEKHTRGTWIGDDPLGQSQYSTSHAVYVHYDRAGAVHDYVLNQLQQLCDAGFRISFVSNAPILRDDDIRADRPFCRTIIWRKNFGYDFGAYKEGIASIGDLNDVDRLLLMNDSIYGPFQPLSEILASIDPSKTDMWGITDSWEFHYHIQSYFLVFFSAALKSEAFRSFWQLFPYINDKNWIIHNGEIRLTQVITKEKLRTAVLCPYWSVADRIAAKLQAAQSETLAPIHRAFVENLHSSIIRGVPLNPTHFFWDTLITEFKCPFIKRELILSNPAGIVYAWRWPEAITEAAKGFDLDIIMRHLKSI